MEENLRDARELVLEYRELVGQRKIDGILDALCEDASIQAPDSPTLKGKSEIRQFYEKRFETGDYQFEIDITHEKVVADLIFIDGTMTRIFTGMDKRKEKKALDFSFILKQEDERFRIWQIRVV